MATYHRARRELLFSRFLTLWQELGREGFRARLEFAITERPPAPDRQDGAGSPHAAGASPSSAPPQTPPEP